MGIVATFTNLNGRTPPGVRELKRAIKHVLLSHTSGRTPPGVRELKRSVCVNRTISHSRTPPGVRELKHRDYLDRLEFGESHPSRGA